MQAQENYSWLKKVDKGLLELDVVPLIRTSFPFDWETLAKSLTSKFDLENISFEKIDMRWRKFDEITEDMGDNTNYLSFLLSPVEGSVFWIMDTEDISKITTQFLTKIPNQKNSFSTPILQEGFYRYIALETLDILTEMNLFEGLSIKLSDNIKPLDEASLCLDLKITVNDTSSFARLVLPSTFRSSWEKYFINHPPSEVEEIASALELPVSLEIGTVALNYEDFKNISIGDFIILDNITYNPKTEKGPITIKLGNTSLFSATVKQGKITLTDFALYSEENVTMEEKPVYPSDEGEPQQAPSENKPAPIASIQQMPITVNVEIAKVKMNLDKLMQLQPGNLLDLPVHPQQDVVLSVNGQKVGKAELINLGETLGIRITEMG